MTGFKTAEDQCRFYAQMAADAMHERREAYIAYLVIDPISTALTILKPTRGHQWTVAENPKRTVAPGLWGLVELNPKAWKQTTRFQLPIKRLLSGRG